MRITAGSAIAFEIFVLSLSKDEDFPPGAQAAFFFSSSLTSRAFHSLGAPATRAS